MTASAPSRLLRATWQRLAQTGAVCRNDEVPRFAAALGFHAALAVVPLVVLISSLGSALFGTDTVQNYLEHVVRMLFGGQTQDALQGLVSHWRSSPSYHIAILVAVVALIFTGSNAFTQLQHVMDGLWGVEMKESRRTSGRVKRWLLSLLGVPVVAAAIMFLLIVVAGLEDIVPSSRLPTASHLVLTFVVLLAIFALVFKIVPRARVAWHDVWIGAALTALLFIAGRAVIVTYLGHSRVITLYGSAGSFVILLLWAYYASLILIVGGAVTAAYAAEFGSRGGPSKSAKAVAEPALGADKSRRRAAG